MSRKNNKRYALESDQKRNWASSFISSKWKGHILCEAHYSVIISFTFPLFGWWLIKPIVMWNKAFAPER